MKVYVLNAFVKEGSGGNPAGVVIAEADFPAAEEMQRIAAQLGYSETAFVLRRPQGFSLRYFTPVCEVPMCGHATIASFAMLALLGLSDGEYAAHTPQGMINVALKNDEVWIDMPLPRCLRALSREEYCALYAAYGLKVPEVICKLPPMMAACGLADIMLPVDTEAELNRAQQDEQRVSCLTQHLGSVGVHMFCLPRQGAAAKCRNFAPACGIPEEAATGTASAALAGYLYAQGVLLPGEYSFIQGEGMGRASEIKVRIQQGGAVKTGGRAAKVTQPQL